MPTGDIPSRTQGLKAAVLANTIFVTGGRDDDNNALSSILSWDPSTETWQSAGDLAEGRFYHAIVSVPSSIIKAECAAET